MKRLILAGLVTLSSLGAVQITAPEATAQPADCSAVLCPTCPPGTVLEPAGANCCRCKKI
jgi:hypothetical protein